LSARASALLASPALAEALTEVDKQSSWLNDEGGGEPLRALRRLVRAHPGLGLDAIVQSDASHAAKAVALGERLALFARVRAALPELRSVSLTRPPTEWSFVEWGHASPDEQRAVAEALRAHQRVLAITSDPGQAEALLTAGLGSAAAIGPTPVPLLAERTGLPIELARPLAEAARRTMGRAGQQALRLRELLGDRLAPRLRFDPAVIGESFRDLPDMAALFGASCRCEPCRSVLSPGAYFADLMCVIESDVIARFFTPATDRSPGHPHALHPRTRRPDLWELPLSCAHTNDEVPTLAIVLEVLERYARELHGASDVYTDVLARGARSLRQPFERAQAEIDAALSKLGSTRLALAEAVGGARDRAALAMSATHAALVFGPAPPAREIEARLGVSLGLPVPMAALMRATHLDRDAVAQVLEARFVRGTDAPSIVRVDEGRAEEVRGLTAGLLDRLHRFERLRAHTGWAARELDAVLSTTGLSVESIGAIRRTQLRFGIDPLEACALCVALPDALVATLFANAQSNRLFVHPAHGGADAATAGVLRAGCRTSEDELVLWLDRLARERGGRAEDGVALNRHTLGWLYRHARLASLLGVRSRELKGLLDLGAGSVSGPASLDALLTLFDASRALGVTLDELALLLGARTDSEEASALAREVLASIERRRLLDVGASVLALRFDVDEATSDVFLRQSGAFEPLGEGTYRWRAGVALDALEVPGALATTLGLNPAEAREAVREALAPFHPAAALPAALAQALGWPLDAAEAWLAGAHASALLTEPALTARLRGLPALRVALRGVHASNIAELLRHRERLGLTRLDPRALEALPALRGLASTEEAPVRLFALEG
ncbi:MAG: hypothetical protein IT378_20995, partial [Sandaracinaceae bacterium]|nr:hypothetical protein [Sandaracinaceae bacterium]